MCWGFTYILYINNKQVECIDVQTIGKLKEFFSNHDEPIKDIIDQEDSDDNDLCICNTKRDDIIKLLTRIVIKNIKGKFNKIGLNLKIHNAIMTLDIIEFKDIENKIVIMGL